MYYVFLFINIIILYTIVYSLYIIKYIFIKWKNIIY